MRLLSACALALGLALAAGCGPKYQVVRQSPENPFADGPMLVVAPMSFEGVQVGKMSEQDYIAKKSGGDDKDGGKDFATKWASDKKMMSDTFAEKLKKEGIASDTALPGKKTLTVKPRVSYLDPGWAGSGTEVQMTVEFADDKGQPLDEISMRSFIGANLTWAASFGSRAKSASAQCASFTGKYVEDRRGGK